MKRMIFIGILIFQSLFLNAQLNIPKEYDQRVEIVSEGSSKITKDPKLGYLLMVKGTEVYYYIPLGKTYDEANETMSDLNEICDYGLFVAATMWDASMFIYGDKLTNGKKVVRFKSPSFSGSAYINYDNLTKLISKFHENKSNYKVQ